MSEPRTLWGLPVEKSDAPPITISSLIGDGTMSHHFEPHKHGGIRTRLANILHRLARWIDDPMTDMVRRNVSEQYIKNIQTIIEESGKPIDTTWFYKPREDT